MKPHEVASVGVNVSGILICPCVEDSGRTENQKIINIIIILGFDSLEVTTFLLRGDRCMKLF